ncbi:MAG: aminotransferase class V-fold PLP-dependent enzyme [Bdellovibrionales bacterium]|nr:aminotransferase class V-fold PLP-dependent enzyme [Bdellovibrionales bacterium]
MKFEKYFRPEPSVIYLNAGTLSRVPVPIMDAKLEYLRTYEINPTRSLISTWGQLWTTQKKFADWLGVEAKDLFLRSNVTMALNDLILGFPLKTEDEILASDLEYGAIINICRLKALNEKASLRLLPLAEYLESLGPLHLVSAGDLLVDYFVSQITPRTKMLLVSHVMSLNGLVVPIEKLAEETARRGIYLVVDGAHALGALPLNGNSFSNVDAYAGNLHKWMMAPKGSGFAWVHPRRQAELRPLQGSWTVFETPQFHEEFAPGYRFASQMLHSSCQDFSSWFAIKDACEFWDQVGPDSIRSRINHLKNKIRHGLRELGWQDLTPSGKDWGPLTSFAAPDIILRKYGNNIIQGLLQDFGIQIHAPPSPRGQITIRFSPSLHNSDEDIDRALKVFKTLN